MKTLHFVHRGMGGAYATYLKQTVKRIERACSAELSSRMPVQSGMVVAIDAVGEPLTEQMLTGFLREPNVTFLMGDSNGLPSDLLARANKVVSVSSLPVGHALEASIVVGQVERIVMEEAFAHGL